MNLAVTDLLVDDPPQALSAGLGHERQPRFPDLDDVLDDFRREASGPQGRQR